MTVLNASRRRTQLPLVLPRNLLTLVLLLQAFYLQLAETRLGPYSRDSLRFMQSESSLSFSQKPAISSHSEPDETTLRAHIIFLFKINCNITYLYTHRYSSRGELRYLAPLGSENISAPYFKQCFLGGVLPPQTESNTTPPSPKTEITNILSYILNFASIIKFKM